MRSTITANGATDPASWHGGRGAFVAVGNFDGGTAKLQMSPDNGASWVDVDSVGDTFVTFTANGIGGFELYACQLRVVVSGATAPSLTFSAERSS